MLPFISKDGRTIVPVDHTADFTGKNNSAKGKVLIWLLYKHGSYFTSRQLAEETGVDFNYLKCRLSFWYLIRYIDRKVVEPSRGRPWWTYCIDDRGIHFVNDCMPPEKRNELTEEINTWRSNQNLASKKGEFSY